MKRYLIWLLFLILGIGLIVFIYYSGLVKDSDISEVKVLGKNKIELSVPDLYEDINKIEIQNKWEEKDSYSLIKLEVPEYIADVLELNISYSGSLEGHDFYLYWDGTFYEDEKIMANLDLVHNAHGDRDGMYISKTIQFDLSELSKNYIEKYNSTEGEVILLIDDKFEMVYEF